MLFFKNNLLNLSQWRTSVKKKTLHDSKHLSPVFIIGANRSGTSIVSYVLAQHPELEGLFSGKIVPEDDNTGHSFGFCESMHIWQSLIPELIKERAAFWGMPYNVGRIYRDKVLNEKERLFLARAIQNHRLTENVPLIKDLYNVFRIGLIKDVFPQARFILVCRSLEEYMPSSIHKWTNDISDTKINHPLTSFHWHMINLIARYDLEIHAPGSYATLWLNNLIKGPVDAQKEFDKVNETLAISDFKYDFNKMKTHWKTGSALIYSDDSDFKNIKSYVEMEKSIISSVDLNIK